MKKANWDYFEKRLDEYDIKPVVAVIPDNKDESLMYDRSDSQFWKRVQRWQNKGWNIAMHGLNHKYHFISSKSFIPFHNKSEFTGLEIQIQKEMIKKSYNIFLKYNIKPEIWIAPSHTFDSNTLKALLQETNIRIISDGLAYFPFKYKGFLWIPQQICNFKNRFFGIWTICYHPNTMSLKGMKNELDKIVKFRKKIINNIDLIENIYKNRERRFSDIAAHKWLFYREKAVSSIYKLIK